MNLNPLLLPEIISKVLEYLDIKTLKESRLVNSFWNNEGGKILSSSSCWVIPDIWDIEYNDDPDQEIDEKRLLDLQQTLVASPNPALFFGKLGLNDLKIRRVDIIFNLLQTYGTFLKALSLAYGRLYHSNSYEKNGAAFYVRLIHRVLTESAPFLQQLDLSFDFQPNPLIQTYSHPELTAPTNLRNIEILILSEIPVEFQDFLLQILGASPKLKVLTIDFQEFTGENERLYQYLTALTALQHMMNKLEKLTWEGKAMCSQMKPYIVPNIHFLSNQLKTLKIVSANVDPKSFHLLINSIGSSLKNLELIDCGFDRDNFKDFQSHLFEIVIKSLVNLETLRIGYHDCSPDHFFSNADNQNAPPHQNLKRLFLPWHYHYNVLEVSSVSNVVKWFPNLTLLSLCLGEYDRPKSTMGVGIRLHEAVGILSGLERLKDLNLRLCSNTAPGDLQLAFKALLHIPSLLCCTFAELSVSAEVGKTIYNVEDLEDELKELKHLNVIRLMGFKINEKEIENLAKQIGVRLEYYDVKKGYFNLHWVWLPDFSSYEVE